MDEFKFLSTKEVVKLANKGSFGEKANTLYDRIRGFINGDGDKVSKEEWKRFFKAYDKAHGKLLKKRRLLLDETEKSIS